MNTMIIAIKAFLEGTRPMDWTAIGIAIATYIKWLPEISALFAVVWGIFRIYEVILSIRLLKKKLKE